MTVSDENDNGDEGGGGSIVGKGVEATIGIFLNCPNRPGRQLLHCLPAFTQAQFLQTPVRLQRQHKEEFRLLSPAAIFNSTRSGY